MAPWSIYPFSPIDRACLICDMLVFDTTVSADALVESLERSGPASEVLLAPADVKLGGDMPVNEHTGATGRSPGTHSGLTSCSTNWPNRTL